MLARHVFKIADPVSGSPCGVRCIRSLSDHAVTPLKGAQHVSPQTLKKSWEILHDKPTRNSSHSNHKQLSSNMSQCANDTSILQWPSSPQHIPNQLCSLQSNIAQRDASAVLQLWRNLEKDNLLHLLEPSVLEKCSRLVINLCTVEPGSIWSGPTREAAEEIALGLANNSSTSALKACFTALITTNDTEGILQLYNRFLSRTEHRIVYGDTDSLGGEVAQGELSTIPTIRKAGFSVDKDLSAFPIIAHAIRDDFSSAIRTGIHAKWSFPSAHATNALLDIFAPSSKFRHKVLTFLRHAHAARLLSHPSVFYKHLHNLGEACAVQHLQNLYATMIEGLSPNYPWVTADSESVSDTRPVAIQESTWAAFISAFLRTRRLDLAESVWDDMVRYGHKPGPGVWTVLIKGVGMMEGSMEGSRPALALFRSMKEAAVTPDSSSYHAVVQLMANTRQWKEAEKLFEEFRSSSSLRPDPNSEPLLTTMISVYLNNSRERDAINLLQEMVVDGPHPTAPTFNAFLTYYHKQKDVKSLSSMLKKMAAIGLSGDIATFSILLCTFLRILDRGEAIRQTLAIMDQHQIKANVATYTAIITSLTQEQDKNSLEAALDLLRMMEESGNPMVTPNVVTYTAILTGVQSWIGRDNQLVQDCTELIVQKMMARGVKFNNTIYHMVLKTCFEIPSPAGVQKALHFYRQMRRENVALTGDTWHIILHGLAKKKEWVVAHEVLRDMQQSGITMPNWLENTAEKVARGYVLYRKRLASATR